MHFLILTLNAGMLHKKTATTFKILQYLFLGPNGCKWNKHRPITFT